MANLNATSNNEATAAAAATAVPVDVEKQKSLFVTIEATDPCETRIHKYLMRRIAPLLQAKGYLVLIVDYPEDSFGNDHVHPSILWDSTTVGCYDMAYFHTSLAYFYRYCQRIRKALNTSSSKPLYVLAIHYIYR